MAQTLQDLLSSRSLKSQARIQAIADCLLLAISKKEKVLKTLNDALSHKRTQKLRNQKTVRNICLNL